MEKINYKFEVFEGPLDLLLCLVEKNKINIADIPIDLICTQYLEYMREAKLHSVELACEFVYMASELMLIKSRMLLPKEAVKDEDPRRPLVNAILEYKRAKLAAAELEDMFAEYGDRMIKEEDVIENDRTYCAEHSIELLKAALIRVYTESRIKNSANTGDFSPLIIKKNYPVSEVINSLIGYLRDAARVNEDFYLDLYFRMSGSRSEMTAKFLAILELIKSHIVSIDDTEADSNQRERSADTGVTEMDSHCRIILTADEETIKAAVTEEYN